MGCTQGSQKKPSAPDSFFVSPLDYGTANIPAFLITTYAAAVEFIPDTGLFCASAPPEVIDYTPADLLNPLGLRQKIIDAVKAQKWFEYCECSGNSAPQEGCGRYLITFEPLPPQGSNCSFRPANLPAQTRQVQVPGNFNIRRGLFYGEDPAFFCPYDLVFSGDTKFDAFGMEKVFSIDRLGDEGCGTQDVPDLPPPEQPWPPGIPDPPRLPPGGPGSECSDCPAGPPGPPGPPGEDAQVEFVEIYVPIFQECGAEGPVLDNQLISVISGTEEGELIKYQRLAALESAQCEKDEPILSLPEHYGLLPGVDRPCLVVIYKERNGEKWGQSTYSTSLFHPSEASLNNFENLSISPKQQGKHFAHIKMVDGGQIKISMNSAEMALEYLIYLAEFVEESFLPTNWQDKIIQGFNPEITEILLYARKLEYYPQGKKNNVAPFKVRYLQVE